MRLLRRKAVEPVEDRALTRRTVPPSMVGGDGQAPAFTADTALRIGDVWSCVRVLVDAAASVPLIAYRSTREGRVRAEGGLADLLTKPAPAVTQSALIGQAVAHLVLWGDCHLGKFRGADGQVDQLALLHPDRVRPEIVAGQPRYVVTGAKGERSTHGVEDILHIRAPLSLDGLTGLSPIRQCRVALGLAEGLGEHALAFFRNGARPSGVLSVPTGLSGHAPEQQDALLQGLREDLSNTYTGTRNAHKIAVMAGDLTWTQLSGPLDDLQFVEQRRLSTSDIARIFRVPAHMVNAQTGDSMTYSNVEQQALDFVTHSLRPWLVCIEQAISNDEDLAPGPLYVEFLLDALLRADSKTRAEVYAAALDPITGWMTRAEVRRLENLPAEPDVAPAPAPIPIRPAAQEAA
jgi:HK97 family phage portal protein